MLAWRTTGQPLDILPQWTIWQLHEQLAKDPDLMVLDVRQPGEWSVGHIARATHITGAESTRRIEEIPRGRPVATICGSGYRSSVAAGLLQRHGHQAVFNVLGGMTGWQAEGLPSTD